MKTKTRIYHDTSSMYWAAVDPRGRTPVVLTISSVCIRWSLPLLHSAFFSFFFLCIPMTQKQSKLLMTAFPTKVIKRRENNVVIHPDVLCNNKEAGPQSWQQLGVWQSNITSPFWVMWGKWLSAGLEPGHSIPLTYWYAVFLPYA